MKVKNAPAPERIFHQKLVREINDICHTETGATGRKRNYSRAPGSTKIGNRTLKEIRLEVFNDFMGWTSG